MVELADLVMAKYPAAVIGPWAVGEGHVVLSSVDGVSSIVAWDRATLGDQPDVAELFRDASAVAAASALVERRNDRQAAWGAYRVAAAQRRLDFLRQYEGYLSGGPEPHYGTRSMSSLSEVDLDNLALSMPGDIAAAIEGLIAEGAK